MCIIVYMKGNKVYLGSNLDHRVNFGGDLDHHADSPNWESGQYEGNELPWTR